MRARSIFLFLAFVGCGILTMNGCGYTTRSMIADKYHTIYIVPFVNKIDITSDTDTGSKYRIYHPMIETDITRAVVGRFILDGNLRPTKQPTADLTLKGEVTEFRKDPLRYADDDTIEEYRINLVVNISLWDNKDNKLVWEEKGFTGDTTYFTTGSSAKSQGTALSDALKDLARRIVERAVEQW